MLIPEDLRYSNDHAWARLEGGEAVIGITAFAAEQLGDIVYVEMPDPGATFAAGDALGVVESAKAASDVIIPIGGTVIAANPALNDSPDLVHEDPYGEGWLVRIQVAETGDLDGLLDSAAYTTLTEE